MNNILLGRDRAGFVSDIGSALQFGMWDSIFEGSKPLSSRRLRALVRWIDVVSRHFPDSDVRARFTVVFDELRGCVKLSKIISSMETAFRFFLTVTHFLP